MMLLGRPFVTIPRRAASQQAHELDQAGVGHTGILRRKDQLRFAGSGNILAPLSNDLLHRNATYCRLTGDNHKQHHRYDREQQWLSNGELRIATAFPFARHLMLARRIAFHRSGKTCALRSD
jgi:hypothetical protein